MIEERFPNQRCDIIHIGCESVLHKTYSNLKSFFHHIELSPTLLQGSINKDEFEEFRKVDYEYRRETVMDESEKLKLALDALGKKRWTQQLQSE